MSRIGPDGRHIRTDVPAPLDRLPWRPFHGLKATIARALAEARCGASRKAGAAAE